MAIFSSRQHLPGSKPKCFGLYRSRVSISLPERHRDPGTYITHLPTANIANQSSQSPEEVTRKVSGYSTAPK